MVDIVSKLKERPWCYDENGQNFPYVEPETADEAIQVITALREESGRLSQLLGKKLGFPWFKDDPKNFPDATEENGVCTGPYTLEDLINLLIQRYDDRGEALRESNALIGYLQPFITSRIISKINSLHGRCLSYDLIDNQIEENKKLIGGE